MNSPVVETRGLRKTFGAKVAVADLSLSVGRGEIFGFLGPNGAGKTTSLKMLLGLVEPSGGEATVLGAPLGDRTARAKIGFLPEHFRFHDWLTGRELLRFHGRLYGLRGPALEARIEALLARVDLLDAAGRAVKGYSKGMLQRVGLAQALLNEPELVLLDEPTSGLDPLGRLLVRDVIRELRRGGTTVFLNSHLLGEVEATCDRVVFVKEGRTVREVTLAGTPASGLEVEIRLTDARGADVGADVIEGLARLGTALEPRPGAVRLRVPGEDALPGIARWLVERGVRLYGMTARRPSLEDLFLAVMGDDQRPG
ncbi:MAG: ABC transporter ATP-binding protein [Candidatus Eisenbacteria bacterium]